MGNIVTNMVTWGTSAVFGVLELIRRFQHIIDIHAIQLIDDIYMCLYAMLK